MFCFFFHISIIVSFTTCDYGFLFIHAIILYLLILFICIFVMLIVVFLELIPYRRFAHSLARRLFMPFTDKAKGKAVNEGGPSHVP